MKKLLLKLFSAKELTAELVQREYPNPDTLVDASAWKQVFHKVPAMSGWLTRREINLLRSFALKEKSQDYILGQIAEVKLAQSFDVPSEAKPVDPGKQEPVKTISRSRFLSGWGNGHADKGSTKTK